MKKFAVGFAMTVAVFGVSSQAFADDGYPPTSPPTSQVTTTTEDFESEAPTTTGLGTPTTTASGLPVTGSDSGSIAQIAVISVLTGIGLVGVATVRRRKPATSAS